LEFVDEFVDMSAKSCSLFRMAYRNDLKAALAQIDADIDEAEGRLEDLRLQRRGAEALLSRMGIPVPLSGEGAESRVEPREYAAGGNASLVYAVLKDAGEGMSLREIESMLADAGHRLDYDQVRSAVTYLSRKKDAERVGRGVWRLRVVHRHDDAEQNVVLVPAPTHRDGADIHEGAESPAATEPSDSSPFAGTA
jgi:hypothetical protein